MRTCHASHVASNDTAAWASSRSADVTGVGAAFTPVGVDRLAPGDRVQPRRQLLVGVEPAGGLPRVDERRLHDVGGTAGIAEDRQGHGVHGTAETGVDITQYGVVGRREADRQVPVAHGNHGSDDSTPATGPCHAFGPAAALLRSWGTVQAMTTSDDDLETTWSESAETSGDTDGEDGGDTDGQDGGDTDGQDGGDTDGQDGGDTDGQDA